MRSPRWQKLLRDLWLARGRTALMVAAIAVSLFGAGTVLSVYAILTPEISRNYLGTHPASATIELDRVDADLLAAVRQRPGIAAAEARETIAARVEVAPDQWRPLLLFVVPDFTAMQLSTFTPVSGAWPPPDGAMLLERTAVEMVGVTTGGQVVVKTPHGKAQPITVSGVVYDPSLAPAWQEREGYGYITPATLARLGETGGLGELKIVVAGSPFDQAAADRTARDLGAWLQQQGHTVRELQIPPAGQHPHQGQMTSALLMLLSFSLLALLLSAILVATLVSGLLAQQIRQIGAMKTVGARTRQIAGMYLGLVLLLSAVALALAAPASVVVGRLYARAVAELLNFTIVNDAIPAWVFAVEAAAGLLVPLLVAAYPILRASRITVSEALSDYGVSALERPARFARLAAFGRLNRTLLLALRNTFRRRGRLLLTLGLLAVGGALFMTGLNIRDGWERLVADGVAARRYQMEVRLSQPEPTAPLVARLRAIPGVQTVEPWGYTPTTRARPGELDVVRTYPDGGHGAFALRAPPADTRLVNFPLLAGRWLRPDDTDAVVLNQMALRQLPGVGVGDQVTLELEGRPTTWRVVGIVQEIGLGAGAYVTDAAFARAGDLAGRTRSLRIVTATASDAETAAVLRAVERSLAESGVSVATTIAAADLKAGLDDHVLLLIVALVFTAVLMGIVGVLGLTSTMSSNIVERTREFGVMQTVGGTPAMVRRMVVSEGVFIGALSWVLAIALALPLSAVVDDMVGRPLFNAPLPLVASPLTMLIWLAVVLVGSALASAVPAWRAARMTIRETLAYV